MKDCYHILCQAFFCPAESGIRKRGNPVFEEKIDAPYHNPL